EQTASTQLLDTLQILTRLVSQRLESGAHGTDGDLEAWVRSVTEKSDLRITLIRANGRVIADSSRTAEQVPEMENHATRPEVREALRTGQGVSLRLSHTTGLTYVYAARTLTTPHDGLLVLRLAQPLEELEALRGRLAAAVILAVGGAVLVIFGVAWWIGRHLFDPLAGLIVGARDLASGRA